MTVTAFTSEKVSLDLVDAMGAAKRTGLAQYLTNRKGSQWLRVAVKEDDSGRRFYQFLDRYSRECGAEIRAAALGSWNLFTFRTLERLEDSLRSDQRLYPSFGERHKLRAINVTPASLNVTQGALHA